MIMRKYLLSILILVLHLYIFAQEAAISERNSNEVQKSEVMWSYYDFQTNGLLSNRMYQKSDASVAVVSTMSHQSNQSLSDRGTGYNYCEGGDMSQWLDTPNQRVEANATGDDIRTGWPSIAPYGEDGEIMVSHTGSGLVYYIRENAGEGVWDGPHSIPNPSGLEGQEYSYEMSWARIATSGDNNSIIHVVAAAQYQIDSENMSSVQLYCRSTDGENWDVDWSPLYQDNEHIDIYDADDYVLSSNGNTVAIVYSGSVYHHVVMYKSEDNGENWERTVIWENPYYGIDWNDENSIYTDTMFGPAQSSVAIDNNGIAHVAISTYAYIHREVGTTYSVFTRSVASDGIVYWNDSREAPIQASNGNPHDALRLWWKTNVGTWIRDDDNVKFCGWLPPDNENGIGYLGFNGGYVYNDNEYFFTMRGLSAYPSIAVDSKGNVVVAYSAPDMTRIYDDDDYTVQYYYRGAYVSYKPYDSDEWNVAAINLFEEEEYNDVEAVMVSALSNPINENEFWFSCSVDGTPGFHYGNNASQLSPTQNKTMVFKVNTSYLNEEDTDSSIVFVQNENQITPGYYQVINDVNESMELTFNLEVTNTTDITMNLICEKTIILGGGENYFCWGECHDTDTYTAELAIESGETATFSSHFKPIDENGDLIPNTELKVEYHFYENISDEHYVFEVYYKYIPMDNELLYVQNRNVVIEEFTGRNCSFCPDGHMITNSLMSTYPGRVFGVNINTGSFSPMSYPNLNTTDGTMLSNAYAVGSFPNGVVNRTSAPIHPSEFYPYIEEQLSQTAEVNISGSVNIDEDFRTAEITIHLYYTANSSQSANYLNIMMLQDSIWGDQSGGDANPEQWVDGQYCHMHVLRDIVTPIWGDAISPTTEGTYMIKKYTYHIPGVIGNPNGVEVDLDNIHFLAFVTESLESTPPSYPILNANMIEIKDDENENEVVHHWEVEPYLYPNRMTMTALLQIDGVEQNNPNFEVGAFCDDELRGSARLQYVGYPINRYLAFMILYGNNNDELSFKLYDHESLSELDLLHYENITFEKGSSIGDINEPYRFNFCAEVLLAPENLYASTQGEHTIHLTWDAVENTLSYNVYRDNEFIDNVTQNSYTNNNLDSNTEYCYVVTSVKENNESAYSDQSCAKTDGVSLCEIESDYLLYPNPIENHLVIRSEMHINEVSIYSISGVLIGKYNNIKDNTIDMSGYTSGTYLIKISMENHDVFKRVVKK